MAHIYFQHWQSLRLWWAQACSCICIGCNPPETSSSRISWFTTVEIIFSGVKIIKIVQYTPPGSRSASLLGLDLAFGQVKATGRRSGAICFVDQKDYIYDFGFPTSSPRLESTSEGGCPLSKTHLHSMAVCACTVRKQHCRLCILHLNISVHEIDYVSNWVWRHASVDIEDVPKGPWLCQNRARFWDLQGPERALGASWNDWGGSIFRWVLRTPSPGPIGSEFYGRTL